MILYLLGWCLRVEGLLYGLPCIIALVYRERQGLVYLVCMAVCLAVGLILSWKQPSNSSIYVKDGMVTAAMAWVFVSLAGAVPFVLTGEIPNYIDALFEIVSGFTTTGASILKNVEALSHATLFWRSFSHWIGGMGVLVFVLMLIPSRSGSGSTMNLMRAESPGYNVTKFVPKVRNTAIILYRIYIIMTITQFLILLFSGMYWFDSMCITFGTAGTGGFSVRNSGCADYTSFQQVVISVFMIAFGVNFSFYYLILVKKVREALKMEEVRWYLIIIASAVTLIAVNTFHIYKNLGDTVRNSLFQVGSIITTTGFSTVDFNKWPSFSKSILILLMCIGACAGSTGGGLKVSRVVIGFKALRRKILDYVYPHNVRSLQLDGKVIAEEHIRMISIFYIAYVFLFALSVLLISLDGFSFETNFSGVAATLNNIGPGLAKAGPASNYSAYSWFSKLVLTVDMLAGRLELFPVLILLLPQTWRRRGC